MVLIELSSRLNYQPKKDGTNVKDGADHHNP
jgi:hypothetical protein